MCSEKKNGGMETVTVNASRCYTVRIGSGMLDSGGAYVRAAVRAEKCVLVADTNTAPLYAGRVAESLTAAGLAVVLHTVPAGEPYKNLQTYGELLECFARNRLTRSDCAVALGGGVVGDMTGFAAATYQRGIDFIQMPTTFLAAVDASVGGKTAVDLPSGKNLAGAFWQPRLVLCDTDTFRTLPEETFRDGVAETLKHGLIASEPFFRFLMTEDIHARIEYVVRQNVEIKAAVVAEDERESGRRKILNFGHTLGHAIETCSGYSVTHGHAVAIGMVLAARGAERFGFSPPGTLETVLAANRRFSLPTDCPFDAARLYDAASGDKKRSGSTISLVVLEGIGKAETELLDMAAFRDFVEAAVTV